MNAKIEKLLFKNNIKLTDQRKLILKITLDSDDHPSAEEICQKAQKHDQSISMATVYRTIALLEQHGFIDKLNFNDGKARYESKDKKPHYHLIDIESGDIIEFESEEFEKLKNSIAKQLGYKIVEDKLTLYCVKS